MMKPALYLLVVVYSGLSGCSNTSGGSSFDQNHRSIQSLGDGLYVVDYKWPYVEKTFGKNRNTAVPAYLEARKLIPAECTRGVAVVRGGETEGGWGWAEFRCKD
jgi:hypothetical protein